MTQGGGLQLVHNLVSLAVGARQSAAVVLLLSSNTSTPSRLHFPLLILHRTAFDAYSDVSISTTLPYLRQT
jgi:hypothetical protein